MCHAPQIFVVILRMLSFKYKREFNDSLQRRVESLLHERSLLEAKLFAFQDQNTHLKEEMTKLNERLENAEQRLKEECEKNTKLQPTYQFTYGLSCHPGHINKVYDDFEDGYHYECTKCQTKSRVYKNRNFGIDSYGMWGEL